MIAEVDMAEEPASGVRFGEKGVHAMGKMETGSASARCWSYRGSRHIAGEPARVSATWPSRRGEATKSRSSPLGKPRTVGLCSPKPEALAQSPTWERFCNGYPDPRDCGYAQQYCQWSDVSSVRDWTGGRAD